MSLLQWLISSPKKIPVSRLVASLGGGDFNCASSSLLGCLFEIQLTLLAASLLGHLTMAVVPDSEMNALHDFYTSTNGPHWNTQFESGNPWVFDIGANPCLDNWVGLECSISSPYLTYHVSSIVLPSCGLYGTLPDSLYELANLTALRVDHNKLAGTIPYSLGSLQNLVELDLSSNRLTGTLPQEMATLRNLVTFSLNENRLSGPIVQAFNPDLQVSLSHINFENNGFTGSIPDNAFANPTLQTMYLGHNCFHGTLPAGICLAAGAQYVELSCLACGTSCIKRYVDQSNFVVSNPVHGSLPACLFNLPRLEQLYLRRNYFSGSLPVDISVTAAVVDLSHNVLEGEVPYGLLHLLSLRERFLSRTLQLHHNKFTSGLDNSMHVDLHAVLDFTYNRFSGPPVGASWPVVGSLLTANIFSCRSDKSDLPAGDKAYNRYQCGSDNVNNPLIAWVVLAVAFVALLILLLRRFAESNDRVKETRSTLQRWLAVVEGQNREVNIPSLTKLWEVSKMLSRGALYITVATVFVLAPVYAALSSYYGTFTHQYAWVLSAVLLSGRVPFALCFACFALLLLGAVVLLFWLLAWQKFPVTLPAGKVVSYKGKHLRAAGACLVYIAVNFAIVGFVNITFVATSIYSAPEYQIAISAFKVIWNSFASPFLSRCLAYELSAARADWFTLELFVSIMNNIGIPLLAVIFVSPLCLYNLVGGKVADLVGDVSELPATNDPFYYSYQCGYQYMDYYCAAFVYICLMTTFGTPLVELSCVWLHKWAGPDSCLGRLTGATLPRVLKPVATDAALIPDRSIMRPFFDATQFLVAQVTSIALILTLGVVFPPLAVTLIGGIVLSTLYTVLKVGRLLSHAHAAGQRNYIEIVSQECAGAVTPQLLKRAFWVLLWFGASFYTLFLFDMLGDAVGFYAAYWVIIVVPLLPLLPLAASFVLPPFRPRVANLDVKTASARPSEVHDDPSPFKSFTGIDDALGLQRDFLRTEGTTEVFNILSEPL
jgi:Leucine-rich repeat (LRR) protein